MNITIRKATIAELEQILDVNYKYLNRLSVQWDPLLVESWTQSEKGHKYFSDKITDENQCMFVAVDGDKIVGFIDGEITEKDYLEPGIYAELNDIALATEYQQKGIGKQLVEEFMTWCKDKQVDHVYVSAFVQNTNAIEFYHKLGFKDLDVGLRLKLK
ncbi:MAG: N-acetyltransferase family protein [Weeksellaceae bacterium]